MIKLEEYINIFESGLYNGQIELANYIVEKIKNKIGKFILKLNYNDLKLYENIFFDELIIDFDINENNDNTLGTSSNNINIKKDNFEERYNYNINSGRLKSINISITSNPNKLSEIKMKLCHELNHLYTYWNITHDDFNEPQNEHYKEYSNILHEWANNVYSKITEHIYLTKYSNYYKTVSHLIIYSLTRFERNVFLCEILSYLFENRDKLKTDNSYKNILKDCSPYKLYTKEFDVIYNKIKNGWTDEQRNILRDTYNYIYNRNYSINKVLHILYIKNIKTIDKLEKNIIKQIGTFRSIPKNIKNYAFESSISFKHPIYFLNYF